MKSKNLLTLFIFGSVLLSLINACGSPQKLEVTSREIENENSELVNLLLMPEDFDPSIYKVDFSQISQRDLEGAISEKASIYIKSFRVEGNEFFLIIQGLYLTGSMSEIAENDFFVFRYKQTKSVYEIDTGLDYIDTTKCTEFTINESKECIFVKKYNGIVSVLSLTVQNHISDEELLQWILPFLEIINKNTEEYLKARS